jgi:hypothetical protein
MRGRARAAPVLGRAGAELPRPLPISSDPPKCHRPTPFKQVLPALLPRLASPRRAELAALALHALWEGAEAAQAAELKQEEEEQPPKGAVALLADAAAAMLAAGGGASRAATLLLAFLVTGRAAADEPLHSRLPAHVRASLASTLVAVRHAPLALALFDLRDTAEAALCAHAAQPPPAVGGGARAVLSWEVLDLL